MKAICSFRFATTLFIIALSSAIFAAEPTTTNNVAGDKAWKELEKNFRPPVPPESWRETRPTEQEIAKFRDSQRDLAGAAADKAKEFYTTFPKHPKAAEARDKEREMLGFAVQLGATNRTAQLEKLDQEHLKDPNLSEDERFETRWSAVQRAARNKPSQAAALAELEKGARELQKEFPKRGEVWELLLMVASNSDADKSKTIATEIIASSAPDQIKAAAKGVLKKMEALGKPLALAFTAVDGRKVDISKMAGKVVLIDFWATWCGPCIAELPNVKAAYAKLHPKGFEIIGISLDEDKEKLQSFVAEEKMTWPQYYDGLVWQNKLAQEFGINSIPAMWLIDKKGIVRDLEARGDLEKKVEKYLAE